MSRVCVLFCLILPLFAADHPKVDSRVFDEFEKLVETSDSSDKGVRIIIHIQPNSDVTFANSRHVSEVADAVLDNQNRFLGELDAGGLLQESKPFIRGTGFRTELLLDYQHAIAGYISDTTALESIADRDDVTYVEFDKLNELFTNEGRVLTGSTTAESSGYGGQNVGVAVIDSNFDLLHPELGGSTSLPNGVVYGGYNYSSNNNQIHSQNFNDCYHGTGTASIVRRYAPDSDLYTLVVFPNAFDSVIANAINWCITNKNGVGGGAPIKVISMSLGGGQYSGSCNSGAMHTAAGNALSNGILVLAASGNNGWSSSTGSPSCSSNVISVGSVWDENGAAYSPFGPAYCSDSNRQEDERACYSNTSGVLDIYAPSEEVICARCGGGTWALGGTSSACPAAAGLVAQLLSYNGSYAGNKSSVVSLLQSTGSPVIGDSGKRRIDIAAAIGLTGGGGCSGTNFTGTLTGAGDQEFEPNGTYYYVGSSGTHSGDLTGPSGTDFDLYLWKWNGSSWSTVASSLSASSSESINYSGTSGYYAWRVYSYSGSGNYDLCLDTPIH